MARCDLCRETVADAAILDHLRVLHPDFFGDGVETWPDGTAVVYDETLEPRDFA